MSFSGEIHVLNKLAELAERFGVSPTIANFGLDKDCNSEGRPRYLLHMIDGEAASAQEAARVEQIETLMFPSGEAVREFARLQEVEKAVDHALALAPRLRRHDGR